MAKEYPNGLVFLGQRCCIRSHPETKTWERCCTKTLHQSLKALIEPLVTQLRILDKTEHLSISEFKEIPHYSQLIELHFDHIHPTTLLSILGLCPQLERLNLLRGTTQQTYQTILFTMKRLEHVALAGNKPQIHDICDLLSQKDSLPKLCGITLNVNTNGKYTKKLCREILKAVAHRMDKLSIFHVDTSQGKFGQMKVPQELQETFYHSHIAHMAFPVMLDIYPKHLVSDLFFLFFCPEICFLEIDYIVNKKERIYHPQQHHSVNNSIFYHQHRGNRATQNHPKGFKIFGFSLLCTFKRCGNYPVVCFKGA